MTLEELRAIRSNIPNELLAATFNDLYFWTVWGVARRMADQGLDKAKVKGAMLAYAEWLGKQAAPQLKMAVPNLKEDPESAARLIAFSWVLHDMKATADKNVVTVTKCLHHKYWKKNKLQDVMLCKDYCEPLMNNFISGALGLGFSLTYKQCKGEGDKICELHFTK